MTRFVFFLVAAILSFWRLVGAADQTFTLTDIQGIKHPKASLCQAMVGERTILATCIVSEERRWVVIYYLETENVWKKYIEMPQTRCLQLRIVSREEAPETAILECLNWALRDWVEIIEIFPEAIPSGPLLPFKPKKFPRFTD